MHAHVLVTVCGVGGYQLKVVRGGRLQGFKGLASLALRLGGSSSIMWAKSKTRNKDASRGSWPYY